MRINPLKTLGFILSLSKDESRHRVGLSVRAAAAVSGSMTTLSGTAPVIGELDSFLKRVFESGSKSLEKHT
jgi:hypothetical protein